MGITVTKTVALYSTWSTSQLESFVSISNDINREVNLVKELRFKTLSLTSAIAGFKIMQPFLGIRLYQDFYKAS